MSDGGGDWSPLGLYDRPPPDPWRAATPAPGSSTGSPPKRQARQRLLVGLVAGATALAVALTGATVIVDRHKQPLALGLFAGTRPPAADTSVAKKHPTARAKPAPDPVYTPAEVAHLVDPGVVVIDSQLGYENAEAAGTGMVLSPNGAVLTNNHVIDGATSITATVVSTGRQYTATVVGTSASDDVAVLQLQNAGGLSTIPLGDSSGLQTGQSVVAVGNAGGRGNLSVVSGSVTSTDRTITASDSTGTSSERLTGMIEVQAPILAGDSGGPLASRAGKVVGMDTAASSSRFSAPGSPTFGFAIPINRALAVAAQIQHGDTSGGAHIGGRGYLGIQVQDPVAGSGNGGAEIIGTTPDSPAAAAGLLPGDVVTILDGQPVASADSLTQSLVGSRPGEQVTVGWTDPQGQSHSAEVTLGTGPAD